MTDKEHNCSDLKLLMLHLTQVLDAVSDIDELKSLQKKRNKK